MSEKNKEEIGEELNELLGLDVNWKNMSKKDLEKLHNFLSEPKNIIKKLLEVLGWEEFIRNANDVFVYQIVEKRPLRSMLKDRIFGEEEEEEH